MFKPKEASTWQKEAFIAAHGGLCVVLRCVEPFSGTGGAHGAALGFVSVCHSRLLCRVPTLGTAASFDGADVCVRCLWLLSVVP